jgi:hypothetical protein
MISKDAMIRSAWHNQQMEEARRRVQDAVKYNMGHGYRLQHTGFKGLPDNSTGSKNRPFFAAKDEVNCPLEDKIQARGGGNAGALWNPAGRKYAKSILERRAQDTSALDEGLEAPQAPAIPSSASITDEKKLEMTQMMAQFADYITSGKWSEMTYDLFRRLVALTLAMLPYISEQKVDDIYEYWINQERTVSSVVGRRQDTSRPSTELILPRLRARIDQFAELLSDFSDKISEATMDEKQKQALLKALLKKFDISIPAEKLPVAATAQKFSVEEQMRQATGGDEVFNALNDLNTKMYEKAWTSNVANAQQIEDISTLVGVLNEFVGGEIEDRLPNGNLKGLREFQRAVSDAIRTTFQLVPVFNKGGLTIRSA